jgi:hypothetical protein
MENKQEEIPINLTPEQIIQDFIIRNHGENRKTRRFMGKMIGVKIAGTNVPYKNNEKK